jgi:hypothetical protein
MINLHLVLSGVAFALAVIGAAAGFTAIALVVGLKNSTHQIQYVPVEPPKTDNLDPFAGEETETIISADENPNKRRTQTNLKVVENDKEDFADLDDVTQTSQPTRF